MLYRGADKSLARSGRKQARKHIRDARGFNNIETRAVIKFVFLQGKAPKEIQAILTETLACLLPVRAEDLSASLYKKTFFHVDSQLYNLLHVAVSANICLCLFIYLFTMISLSCSARSVLIVFSFNFLQLTFCLHLNCDHLECTILLYWSWFSFGGIYMLAQHTTHIARRTLSGLRLTQ